MSDTYPNGPGMLRIGDRAAAYIRCLEWRQNNPKTKLLVLDDPYFSHPDIAPAQGIPARWMFQHIADEIWETTEEHEILPVPEGERVDNTWLWLYWKHLGEKGTSHLHPKIQPTKEAIQRVQKYIKVKEFITVQPLFDAQYNTIRNVPVPTWNALLEKLSQRIHVVVIGKAYFEKALKIPAGCIRLWCGPDTVMDSFAAIAQAKLHITGETGTVYWSPIFKTPTAAILANVAYKDALLEPLSFGQEVLCIKGKQSEPAMVIEELNNMQVW